MAGRRGRRRRGGPLQEGGEVGCTGFIPAATTALDAPALSARTAVAGILTLAATVGNSATSAADSVLVGGFTAITACLARHRHGVEVQTVSMATLAAAAAAAVGGSGVVTLALVAKGGVDAALWGLTAQKRSPGVAAGGCGLLLGVDVAALRGRGGVHPADVARLVASRQEDVATAAAAAAAAACIGGGGRREVGRNDAPRGGAGVRRGRWRRLG